MSGLLSRKPVVTAVLLGSLAINLFLGGFLIAREMYGPERVGPMHFRPNAHWQDDGALTKYRAALEQRRGDLRQGYLAFRRAREDVKQAMSAEPFNAIALQQGLNDMRQAASRLQAVSQEALIAVSKDLTAQERRDLVEALNLRLSGPPFAPRHEKSGSRRERHEGPESRHGQRDGP